MSMSRVPGSSKVRVRLAWSAVAVALMVVS